MKNVTSSFALLLVLILILSFTACGKKSETSETETGLWEKATYLSDTELGQGATTVLVEVKAEDRSIKFTVHTDETIVGAALLENDLIAGDEGEYGLYIKVVNGITADYDVDQSYWAFYIDGEYAMAGIDCTEITEGAAYQLVYTK